MICTKVSEPVISGVCLSHVGLHSLLHQVVHGLLLLGPAVDDGALGGLPQRLVPLVLVINIPLEDFPDCFISLNKPRGSKIVKYFPW